MASTEITVLVNKAEFDESEFRKAIWEMYLLEVLWRSKGNEKEADRLMKLRVRLKSSVGIETTYKDEENH